MSIPIIIGVTGHRDLRPEDIPALRELVLAELKKLKTSYPNSPFVMLNSLAAGADQLCAEAALELGISLVCPLPLALDEYRKDFAGLELENFERLLQSSKEAFTVPDTERKPPEFNRDHCYRQAGIYIATHSHVLLALWDGSPAEAKGCGTSEVVDFMLHGSPCEIGFFKADNDGAVLHIRTNRISGDTASVPAVRLIENQAGCLVRNLSMTDSFNLDAKNNPCPDSSYELLPDKYMGSKLRRISSLYHQADFLSLLYQKKNLSTLKAFAVFGVLLVLTFMLYGQLDSRLFLFCYASIVVLYFVIYLWVKRSKSHEKHLQYRVLAETLRVQFYMSASGQKRNSGENFAWTQKRESSWVKEAVSGLVAGASEKGAVPDELIKSYWIDGQLDYHKKALQRNSPKLGTYERLSSSMYLITLFFSLFTVVIELLGVEILETPIYNGALPALFMQSSAKTLTLHNLLKVFLGVVSATSAFLSSYYGKLSLGRKCLDHEKMVLLYTAAQKRFEEAAPDNSSLFAELAREEIIENGNWFSYSKGNGPAFRV